MKTSMIMENLKSVELNGKEKTGNRILKRIAAIALLIGAIGFPAFAEGKGNNGKANMSYPFYYSSSGIRDLNPEQIVCKPDADGKYLELHRKYNFSYDRQGRMTKKEAYKWDASRKKWNPDYLLTYNYSPEQIEAEYAVWNKREKTYNPPKEKVIYTQGEKGIFAYLGYKRTDSSEGEGWELVTNLTDMQSNQLWAENGNMLARKSE
ncbi:MAG: DUF3836 domain-containing protein [Tannerellaceae bacterium]|jgi:hypothetical protein|nr:DUF3836 domain-containing protein [Tannerellaceae bacterium]